MSARIRFRRSTAAVWTSINPILTTGELGYETDTGKFKIGDNATAWTGLAYSVRAQLSEGYLNDLADVTITSPTSGQVLKWNGTAWINDTGGSAINALDDITDVTITSAASGDILKWNGSAWVNDSALLAAKAPLASPTFTGVPAAPTAAQATNTTQIATTAFVRAEVTALVNGATATLDTLGEIATALGSDANLSTTLTTSIGLKAPLASPTFTGTVTIPSGASISDFAPLASPSLTGTPLAPTAAGGTNTTQIATTAFVTTAVSVLDNVGDVTITSAASGQLLQWNGSAWINATVSGADPVVQSMMYR